LKADRFATSKSYSALQIPPSAQTNGGDPRQRARSCSPPEIARHLSRPSDTFVPARGIHLVFFVNEELPFKAQNVPVKGMIALETLGYFSDAPGTQNYPQSFGLIYR
jgi:hypothetical protein